MKRTFLFVLMLIGVTCISLAQVAVNSTNANPDESAMLDVSSDTKGFLPPRMLITQRDQIVAPEEGLIIYNTDSECMNFYNGLTWVGMGCNPNPSSNPDGCPDAPTVTDYDGITYQTVLIGTQCWMKENLKVTHYPNGDAIPFMGGAAWKNLTNDNYSDGYCYYNDDPNSEYGALYSYSAAIADFWQRDNVSLQGICPDGWHIPSYDEFQTLSALLGGDDISGGKLKESGTTHWNSPNTGATNESKFSALGGGYRNGYTSISQSAKSDGKWWSSLDAGYNAYVLFLQHDLATSVFDGEMKDFGYSIRCIKND